MEHWSKPKSNWSAGLEQTMNTAKSKSKALPEFQTAPWHSTNGLYIAGRAEVDDLDAVAVEMEAKWGCDRLRLLVPVELRVKFDRQRYLTNHAIWHGELDDVRRECRRMITAWRALDRVATEAGAHTRPPEVWEVALSDGAVAAIVRDNHAARSVLADGRHVHVYTLDEIGRLISGFPALAKIKETFRGAAVTGVRTQVDDPLHAIHDSKEALDDAIPF